ncbi:hypothetical protein [Sphingobium aromaticiconvertens]|uniref:hypothetical protein n=1 Tax=Sphingobium aromaticiconvertens TaxID=365341 RepID=UPI0030180A45
MSGVLIIAPLALAATPTVAGTGAANLLTADPNEAWIAPSLAPVTIDIDMGAVVAVDSFCLAYTNADVAASWWIEQGTGLGAGLSTIVPAAPMRAADSEGPRHHCFASLDAPVEARYFRITVSQSGAAPLYVGALVIGLQFEKHRERGGGRTPVDTGSRQDLASGGFGTDDGVVKAQFAFSFIDLTDEETRRLWSIKRGRGLRKPIVVIENADLAAGFNEAFHYGVFERFQPYEDVEADNVRWACSVVEWA